MLIGIDGNEANVKEKVGVSTYAFELLRALNKLNQQESNPDTFSIYLKEEPRDNLPKENEHWEYRVLSGGNNWILSKLTPELFRRTKPDVFFSPTHYTPFLAPLPKIFTLHDLGYLKFSEHFKKYDFWQLKYWTAISVFVSKYIIAVSESTKRDIVRQYHFTRGRVGVVHHGYDKSKFNNKIPPDFVRRVTKKYNIPGDYILFLSTLKPSKNIEGLLDAFDLIKNKFPKYKLVIAGKKGWLYESIYKKVRKLGLEERLIFTDYVDEKDKPALINGAKVFVLCSFWEGFGMDVLNALSCGTPVVVSRVASLPEVAGDAGIYVNPKSTKSIARGLEKVLSLDKVKYNSLVKKGLVQVERFSWEKTAQKTLKLIKSQK